LQQDVKKENGGSCYTCFSILNRMAKSQIKQLEIQINACIELMRNDYIASNSENVSSAIEGDVLKY
jgi:hypothetical protein